MSDVRLLFQALQEQLTKMYGLPIFLKQSLVQSMPKTLPWKILFLVQNNTKFGTNEK